MIDQLWNAILDFTSQLVIPDWAALIALLPVFLLIVIVIWLILLVRKFATAGPTRRGKRRITPVAPSGIHMPGPSWAPLLAAIGSFFLLAGLVAGGPWLAVGGAILVITLIAWGRDALRDYDQIDRHSAPALPAVVHEGPPPGVHMPGPSFRPLLASLAMTVLFFGLVFGGWLLIVGVMLTVVTLLGWLFDARHEYTKVVEADRTGHLGNIPEPRWPRRVLWVGALLVAIALLVDNGIVPPRSGTAIGGEPGTSPAPSGAPPPGEAPASGEPPPSGQPDPNLPEGDVIIVAQGIAFTTTEVSAPAGDFTIVFDNRDQGTPHDVDIAGADGGKVFDGDIFPGPEARVYDVTGIAAGSYEFFCSVHPTMTGTITVP